jgi:phosphoribosylformylglycinamidine cyclo-ligase
MKTEKLDYHNSVNYDYADPAKVLAQKQGRATARNLPFNYQEVGGTRGESVYVFDMGNVYGALVQEGLGTKSLIAQAVYQKTGENHFAAIAQDTVATFVNDLISVGATPVVTNAYWSSSSYKWLTDRSLTQSFIKGWRKACDEAQITWGGGETQSLPGIVQDGALELAGSAFGVIKPKRQLVSEANLRVGDTILLVESSGVHANGISMIREIAKSLNQGYQTKLDDGSELGKTVLTPTHLYNRFVRELFNQRVNVHYLSNITGHGWRKIMRATSKFSYVMEVTPPIAPIFRFIAQQAGNDDNDMYSNYNMGTGYAVYLPAKHAIKAQRIAQDCGFKSWLAGAVTNGPRQVIIKPKNIVYAGTSLEVR